LKNGRQNRKVRKAKKRKKTAKKNKNRLGSPGQAAELGFVFTTMTQKLHMIF